MSHSSMLDLVRRTCDDAEDMPEFEGVYEPDPEQVREWQEREPESYNGEMRYVNLGPKKVLDRLEVETDPVEREALKVAESYWRKAGGYASGGMEAGSVFRGEQREAIHAGSMQELANNVSPVEHVYVGDLGAGGIPKFGKPVEPSDYVDRGIIDWGYLLGMGSLPESEDWF
jgi:hypothetical protein